MAMTTGVLSRPMAMTRSARATQKGAAVDCSGSGGSVYTSGASPPSAARQLGLLEVVQRPLAVHHRQAT